MRHPILRAMGLLLLLVLVGPAVASDDGMTLRQVAEVRAVGRAGISPDGRHVAYLLSVPRSPGVDDDGPAWSELQQQPRRGHSLP